MERKKPKTNGICQQVNQMAKTYSQNRLRQKVFKLENYMVCFYAPLVLSMDIALYM
jgi:hypothetical protein